MPELRTGLAKDYNNPIKTKGNRTKGIRFQVLVRYPQQSRGKALFSFYIKFKINIDKAIKYYLFGDR